MYQYRNTLFIGEVFTRVWKRSRLLSILLSGLFSSSIIITILGPERQKLCMGRFSWFTDVNA